MRLEVQIKMDSAAFDGEARGGEIGRILRELAGRFEATTLLDAFRYPAGQVSAVATVADIHGNHVEFAQVRS